MTDQSRSELKKFRKIKIKQGEKITKLKLLLLYYKSYSMRKKNLSFNIV